MSWKKKASDKQYEKAPPVPVGYHELTILRCITKRKSGEELTDKNGNPKMMLIVGDYNHNEGIINYTLTSKADWKLARDLSRFGVDLDDLDYRGVTVDHWKSQDFANEELQGLTFYAQVEQNGSYLNITAMHADELPAQVLAQLGGRREPEPNTDGGETEQESRESTSPNSNANTDATDDDKLPF